MQSVGLQAMDVFVPIFSLACYSRGATEVVVDLPDEGDVKNVVELFEQAPSPVAAEQAAATVARPATSPITVFIGHGHDPQWERLANHLRQSPRYDVIHYGYRVSAGRPRTEVLGEMLDKANIAFLVHTAEDEGKEGDLHARENVIHEAGLFQGRLGFPRAIVLLEDGCAQYSNIEGLDQIRFPKGQIDTKFGDVHHVIDREFPP